MDFLRRLYTQARQLWTGLSTPMKAVFGTVVAALVAAATGVGFWASQPNYEILYQDLTPEQAAVIKTQLDDQNIAYREEDEGKTILVSREQVAPTRTEIAESQLVPGSDKGWELFDESQFGMTPFQQDVAYQRALQGSLATTLKKMPPIRDATVLISQPDNTPFVREKQPTTATVTIFLEKDAEFEREQTSAVVAVVAGSVKGLTPENVTLVDGSSGKELTEHDDPFGIELNSKQLAYQRETESYLAAKAEDLLAKVVGTQHASVQVTADINFQRSTESSETYDPDGKVLWKEEAKSRKSRLPAVGGPVGAVANVPNQLQPARYTGLDGDSEEDESKSEYLVSHVNRTSEVMQGVVERLTVAVVLTPPADKKERRKLELHDGLPTLPITQAEAENLVKQAVGFKASRGDQITVTVGRVLAPAKPPAKRNDVGPATEPSPSDKTMLTKTIDAVQDVRNLSIAGAILAAGGIAYLIQRMRRRRREAREAAEAAAAAEALAAAQAAEEEEDEETRLAREAAEREAAEAARRRLVPPELRDLDAVALVLRRWLGQT